MRYAGNVCTHGTRIEGGNRKKVMGKVKKGDEEEKVEVEKEIRNRRKQSCTDIPIINTYGT